MSSLFIQILKIPDDSLYLHTFNAKENSLYACKLLLNGHLTFKLTSFFIDATYKAMVIELDIFPCFLMCIFCLKVSTSMF